MVDVLTKKQRSYNMSRIRGKSTSPELKIKPVMVLLGFEYQPKIFGSPDYALIKRKIAVFIDGSFCMMRFHGILVVEKLNFN